MSDRPGFRTPDVVAAAIDSELEREPNMETYVYGLQRQFKGLITLSRIEEFANVIEPRDRVLGPDETAESASAFYRGGVLGLRAAQALLPLAVSNVMDHKDVLLGVPDIEKIVDPYERIHVVASAIIDAGRKGMELWPDFEPYVTKWGELITPNICHQPFVHHGFGVVLKHAQDAVHLTDLQDMEFEIEMLDEYDGWDDAFKDLTVE